MARWLVNIIFLAFLVTVAWIIYGIIAMLT